MRRKPGSYLKSCKSLRSSISCSSCTFSVSVQGEKVGCNTLRSVVQSSWWLSIHGILRSPIDLYVYSFPFYWLLSAGVRHSRDPRFSSLILTLGCIEYLCAVVYRLLSRLIRPLDQPSCHPGKHHVRSPPKKFEESSCTRFIIETRTDIRSSGSCRLNAMPSWCGACSSNICRRSWRRLLHDMAFPGIHCIAIVAPATRVYPNRWTIRGIFRFPDLGWRYLRPLVTIAGTVSSMSPIGCMNQLHSPWYHLWRVKWW